MVVWGERYSMGAGWWRTSVFFKLTSSPKSWAASAKQEVRHCWDLSVWATMAASSAKKRSRTSCLSGFVWAWSFLGLNRLPSKRSRMNTAPSSSMSSILCIRIIRKKMLNRVGERTQHCFTPLTIGKGPERSLFKTNLNSLNNTDFSGKTRWINCVVVSKYKTCSLSVWKVTELGFLFEFWAKESKMN